MAWALAEWQIIRMRRPYQHFAKSANFFGVIHFINPQGVLILLVKTDRALGPRDLIGVSHFAPCGDAAEIHLPHYPTGKPTHQLGMIIIGHSAARTIGDNRFD